MPSFTVIAPPVPAIVLPPLPVLNPEPTSDLNYDYGFQRKRPISHLTAKQRAGAAQFRELTDVAHSFVLSWADRSLATVQALKNFYEQHRGRAFILVDHDASREYVGRFVTPVEPVETRNLSWTVQSVQFDEQPLIPMRNYPQNWTQDAIWMHPFDIQGNPQVTTSGAWTMANDSAARFNVDVANPGTSTTDWAQMQYVGYGFQLFGRSGPAMGIANVFLDAVQIGTIDFYSAAATPAQLLFSYPAVPYGAHRVKLVSTNTKNAAATSTNIVWDCLRVMR